MSVSLYLTCFFLLALNNKWPSGTQLSIRLEPDAQYIDVIWIILDQILVKRKLKMFVDINYTYICMRNIIIIIYLSRKWWGNTLKSTGAKTQYLRLYTNSFNHLNMSKIQQKSFIKYCYNILSLKNLEFKYIKIIFDSWNYIIFFVSWNPCSWVFLRRASTLS